MVGRVDDAVRFHGWLFMERRGGQVTSTWQRRRHVNHLATNHLPAIILFHTTLLHNNGDADHGDYQATFTSSWDTLTKLPRRVPRGDPWHAVKGTSGRDGASSTFVVRSRCGRFVKMVE